MIPFSREHEIRELKADLEALGLTDMNGDGASSRNTFSGGHFELADGFHRGEHPSFDLPS